MQRGVARSLRRGGHLLRSEQLLWSSLPQAFNVPRRGLAATAAAPSPSPSLVRAEDVPAALASGARFIDCGTVEAYLRAHVPTATHLPCEASLRDPSNPHHVITPAQFDAVAAHMRLRR